MKPKFSPDLCFRSGLVTLLGLSLHLFLGPSMNLLTFMFAFPMIYLVTSYWGFVPALVSIILWTGGLSFFDFEPRYSFHVADPREFVHLITFIVSSISVSFIVERKEKIERRLREDKLRLEQENDIRDSFVNTLSHDLRTPLSIARMNSEMILRSNRDEYTRKHLLRINAGLSRIDSMISNLLDGRQLSVGNPIMLNKKVFNLDSLFQRVFESFEVLHSHRLSLKERAGDIFVNWSEDHIQRCLENLIMNAIKYGDPERPIEIGFSRKDDDRISFWVRNHGEAIKAEKLSALFEPYVRGETSRGKQGWGLGLNLIREIVKAHSGNVSATSTAAEGTTFSIQIPANP